MCVYLCPSFDIISGELEDVVQRYVDNIYYRNTKRETRLERLCWRAANGAVQMEIDSLYFVLFG